MMRVIRSVTLAAAICVISAPAIATEPPVFSGQATAIDGDTIEIHGRRVRLNGIDAPESRQICEDAAKNDVRCGKDAAFFLADLMGRHVVTCHEGGTDKYRRTIASCEVQGQDIGDAMVRAGHALAYRKYSTRYVEAEDAAKSAKVGMWRYDFLPPWEWRALERSPRAAGTVGTGG